MDSSYWENVIEHTLGSTFEFTCECGGLPYGHTSRGNCYWKMTSNKHFQTVYDTEHTDCWESYVPLRKERYLERICYQASIYRKLSRFKHVSPPSFPEDLNTRFRAVCFPPLSEICKHIPRSYQIWPWKVRLPEVCLRVLGDILC